MSNTDTSIATFTRILNALSTLNLQQLQVVDKLISGRVQPTEEVAKEASVPECCQTSCTDCDTTVNAPESKPGNFALLLRTDEETTIYTIGTRDECLKNINRSAFTEVDANRWIYKDRVVSIVPILPASTVDVTPPNEGEKPIRVVMLFDNGIPCGSQSFNSTQAVNAYIKGRKQDEYRIIVL